MNIFFYLTFIVAALIISYFAVNKYLDIKNKKAKNMVNRIIVIIFVLGVIFLVLSLIYFFKLMTKVGPI